MFVRLITQLSTAEEKKEDEEMYGKISDKYLDKYYGNFTILFIQLRKDPALLPGL